MSNFRQVRQVFTFHYFCITLGLVSKAFYITNFICLVRAICNRAWNFDDYTYSYNFSIKFSTNNSFLLYLEALFCYFIFLDFVAKAHLATNEIPKFWIRIRKPIIMYITHVMLFSIMSTSYYLLFIQFLIFITCKIWFCVFWLSMRVSFYWRVWENKHKY